MEALRGVVRGAAVVYDFAPRNTPAVVRVVPMHCLHRGALREDGRTLSMIPWLLQKVFGAAIQ